MLSSEPPAATRTRSLPSILHRFGILLALFALTLRGSTNQASAANWNNAAGGDFTNPANWQGGVTPGPNDTATLNLGPAEYSVLLGEDWATRTLAVGTNFVTLDLGFHTLTTQNFPGSRNSISVAGLFSIFNVRYGFLKGNGMIVGNSSLATSSNTVEVGPWGTIELESNSGELVVVGGAGNNNRSELRAVQGYIGVGQSGAWIGGNPANGGHGPGTVALYNDSVLESAGDIHIGPYGGSGSLLVNTDSGVYSDRVYVGGDGFGAAGSGLLSVEGGGKVFGDVTIWSTGTLEGDEGTILGNVTNQGRIDPNRANQISELYITGALDATHASSRLEFDLAGVTSIDRLHVDGPVSLGGVIDIDLKFGFAPTLGSSFDLLSFSSLTDAGFTFDFSDAPLGEGLTWDTSTFLLDGTIHVAPVVPEPSAMVLAGVAAVGILFFRWRKGN